jgi:histone H3/H4
LAGLAQRYREEVAKQNEKPAIPRLTFQRVVREILEPYRKPDCQFRFQSGAIDALRESSEAFLVQVFEVGCPLFKYFFWKIIHYLNNF